MNCNSSRKLKCISMGTALGITALVAACGGGLEARITSVNAITADAPPTYDRLASFSVTGSNLGAGVMASASGCAGITVLSSSTATYAKLTCTPDRDGDIRVSVLDASGAILKTETFNVPKPLVKMVTSLGNLVIELEPAKAPVTVKNFLDYVQDGYFENTVFHRIYSSFVAQGGAFTYADSSFLVKAPTRPPIALEKTALTGLSNLSKTIGMARTSMPDSATSQFYINLADNAFLDSQRSTDGNGYAVFGSVLTTPEINSESTLAAMKAVQVMSNGAEISLPVNPPLISAMTRLR